MITIKHRIILDTALVAGLYAIFYIVMLCLIGVDGYISLPIMGNVGFFSGIGFVIIREWFRTKTL